MTVDHLNSACQARRHAGTQTSLRLFCFPHGGAGAAAYSGWVEQLPPGVETCGVRYPGRESRIRQAPLPSLVHLVELLADELLPWFDLPFAFFGHSMGALVAFELARNLRAARRRGPLFLFVSGHAAPQLPLGREPIHHLPDAEFLERVCQLGGTPTGLFAEPELRAFILPILRADFVACEQYVYQASPPLGCLIVAIGGLEDPHVKRDDIEAWRSQTSHAFASRMIPGDHFFVQSQREEVVGMLAAEAERLLRDVNCQWRSPSRLPELPDDEVHVWTTATQGSRWQLERAQRLLSEDELARAATFVFDGHRHAFIFRRASMRRLLAAYAGLPPGELRFRVSPQVKPQLVDDGAAPSLRFSVTHSDGMALLAVTRGREVGVDLEAIRPIADLTNLARTCLSPDERRDLAAFDERQRMAAFFQLWTCKEAIVKARGVGLSAPLQAITVGLQPGGAPQLVASGDEPARGRNWHLRGFAPLAGFSAAVVTKPRPPCARCGRHADRMDLSWTIRRAINTTVRRGGPTPSKPLTEGLQFPLCEGLYVNPRLVRYDVE